MMLAPFSSGDAGETESTDKVLFNPPPFTWVGGSSRVVPTTVAPPSVSGTRIVPEVRGLRSEIRIVVGKVVSPTTRKRNRSIFAPVLFVNVRRIESVPKVELFAGSLVKSRTTFGASVSVCAGSSGESSMVFTKMRGD